MTIDYDKYGHCCLCHKDMLIDQVIDGRVQKRFTADYTEKEYLLDDGTKMRVALCIDCAETADDNTKKIMQSVVRGWEEEVNEFKHWDKEKKDNYLRRYSTLKIVGSTKKAKEHGNNH